VKKVLALILPVVAAAGLSRAQHQQAPLVFRAGANYIRVDVVVTDGHDEPVTDLADSDFTILEHGQPQTITDFQYVHVPVAHRSIDAAAVADVPPPDVATNAPPSPNSHIWAIVVDDLHIIEQDLIPTKRVLTDLVQSIPPDDQVAVVYVGRSDLSQNFTNNTGLLLAAVGRLRNALGFGFDTLPGGNRIDGETGTLIGQGAHPGYVGAQARTSSDVLRYVAEALTGSSHERRAIIYVGGMTTIPSTGPGSEDYKHELEKAFDKAKRADVPIYTLDPRGNVGVENSLRHGIGEIPDAETRALVHGHLESQWGWLSTIAINTGGRAFFRTSDLPGAVHDLVQDNNSFYLLGYSPSPFPHDGQFHTISVKVRRPGVHVRARQGYVAPGAAADVKTLQATMNDAMAKGVDVSDLTLRAWAAPLAVSTHGMKVAVAVEVSLVEPEGEPHKIRDQLRMNVLALDPDGHVQASSARAMEFVGSVPRTGKIAFFVDDALDLPTRPVTLRIGVASQSRGRAGSIQLALDVPRAADDDLQMSGIAVAPVGEPAEATLRAGALGGLVPFQPTTERTFAASATLRAFGRVFWRAKDVPPTMTLSIRGGSKAPRTLTLGDVTTQGSRSEAVLDTRIALSDLPAGSYVLEIATHPASGSRPPVVRQVPFTVK